jgi:preprotein translocase subunit YajC
VKLERGQRVVTRGGQHGHVDAWRVERRWNAQRLREDRWTVVVVQLDNGARASFALGALELESKEESHA